MITSEIFLKDRTRSWFSLLTVHSAAPWDLSSVSSVPAGCSHWGRRFWLKTPARPDTEQDCTGTNKKIFLCSNNNVLENAQYLIIIAQWQYQYHVLSGQWQCTFYIHLNTKHISTKQKKFPLFLFKHNSLYDGGVVCDVKFQNWKKYSLFTILDHFTFWDHK